MALVLFWIDKTPTAAGVTIVVIAALLIYPVIHFFPSKASRIVALTVAWGLIGVFGWRIWPKKEPSKAVIQPPSFSPKPEPTPQITSVSIPSAPVQKKTKKKTIQKPASSTAETPTETDADKKPCEGSLVLDGVETNQNGSNGTVIQGAPCHAHINIRNFHGDGNTGTGLLIDKYGNINGGIPNPTEPPKATPPPPQ